MKKLLKVCLLALSTIALFSCGNQNNNATTWKVEFMLNNGTSEVYKTVEVNNGEKVDAPSDPSRNGYTFGGWYVDEACQVYFDEGTEVITADTKLYASWASSGLSGNDSKPETSENESNDSEISSEEEVSTLPGSTEAPTEGYALVINGTNYVTLTHNPEYKGEGEEWCVKGLQLEEGYLLTMYDGTNSLGWAVKIIDSFSTGTWTGGDDGITCGTSGTYDVYCKLIPEKDTIYFGPAA